MCCSVLFKMSVLNGLQWTGLVYVGLKGISQNRIMGACALMSWAVRCGHVRIPPTKPSRDSFHLLHAQSQLSMLLKSLQVTLAARFSIISFKLHQTNNMQK